MKNEEKSLTPLMKQYWEVKSVHTDKIVFFRMGDFYELFYDDAKTAAPLLGIALTQRNKKSEDHTPMCGMPHHSIANSVNKLLGLGFKIAICDQIEDPKLAQGLVKRAVTRILTPGVVYDPTVLDSGKNHYIAALDFESISFCDVSTGESFYFRSSNLKHNISLVKLLSCVEIITTQNFLNLHTDMKDDFASLVFSTHEFFASENDLPLSAQLLLSYVLSLGNEKLVQTLQPFQEKELLQKLYLGSETLRHLEIFQNNKGSEENTFWTAINRTKTSSGKRLLKEFLIFPLDQKATLERRYDLIENYRNHLYELKKIRDVLAQMGDLERRLAKIALPQANARDLRAIAEGVFTAQTVLNLNSRLYPFEKIDLNQLESLSQKCIDYIKDDAPLTTKQGQIFSQGLSRELDELIELSTNSAALIQALEEKERSLTGISSLKIRYNNVFGYFIEVTNTHKDKIPEKRYLRKQTLSNAERYCTDELIEIERKVLSANSKRNELEFSFFTEFKEEFIQLSSVLHKLCKTVSEIDVFTSLAWLSLEENYTRPIRSESQKLHLIESRHPVVEQSLKAQNKRFNANTIELDFSHCDLITGPNMAGKSTLMRQIALTVLLSQMGSFVPAIKAELPLFDSIFTRIGASDHLSEGLSTFMVEMKETAETLKNATSRSLIILDEIGRGTATFDGLSLAQAILEHLLVHPFSHVFFATHYHELTDLSEKYLNLHNKHMKIQLIENKNIDDQKLLAGHSPVELNFLYVYSPGAAGESYGIHVARLAGLPPSITDRAEKLLTGFQSKNKEISVTKEKTKSDVRAQMSLFELQKHEFITELQSLDINLLTPIDALNRLSRWQKEI